jgi:hypothetical protein
MDVEDAATPCVRRRLELHLQIEPPLGPDSDGDFPRLWVNVRADQLARLDLREPPLGVALKSKSFGAFPAGLRIDVPQAPSKAPNVPVGVPSGGGF